MWLQNEIGSRLPKSLFQPPVKYIGIHLRFSDNVIDFEKDFSRLANITRDFNNFLSKANNIRKDTGISRIYLATDYAAIVDTLTKEEKDGFTFSFQPDAPRTNTKDHLWFNTSRKSSAAAIATDVEVLRRADYLIGSFHSNVYRLATELNTAYNAGKYPITMKRHLTVDLEWYEDP
jgi:Alpha-(1,6)-fucosyltransferase N- and catalytic domains